MILGETYREAITKIRPCNQRLLPELERYLGPGVRVLDVGCGSGAHAHALSLSGATVHGVDKLRSCVSGDRASWPHVIFSQQNALHLAFKDCSFGVVANLIMMSVLEKRERRQALAEFVRVLSDGGVLHIAVLGRRAGEDYDAFSHQYQEEGWMMFEDPETRRASWGFHYSDDQLRTEIESSGLTLIAAPTSLLVTGRAGTPLPALICMAIKNAR